MLVPRGGVRFTPQTDMCGALAVSALGTYAVQQTKSALPPINNRKSRHATNGHVCFTPKSGRVRRKPPGLLRAKSGHSDLFDHLVGCQKNAIWYGEA